MPKVPGNRKKVKMAAASPQGARKGTGRRDAGLRAASLKSRLQSRRPVRTPGDGEAQEHKSTLSLDPGSPPRSVLPFSVVGIGASAGGFEALSLLLSHVPKETELAIVVIQHLDPNHESRLKDLLQNISPLAVEPIRPNTVIKPRVVYVLPANANVEMIEGNLRLVPRQPRPNPMPIDWFFRSLASEQQNRAIGVVLSGTGSDGTFGLNEIKGHGGITFAQDKGTSKYFGMPGSAIGAGYVDFVLTPQQIAEELVRLSAHPYLGPSDRVRAQKTQPVPEEAGPIESFFKSYPEELKTLFTLLRRRSGVDFSLYKPGTLNRRIMRRMALHRVESLPEYVRHLQQQAEELDALFRDLLINVTGFFRDPSSFQALEKRLLPKILKQRSNDRPLRVWTCGCSTGEEAYSLAIVISEYLEKAGKRMPVQIFASDLNEQGIEKARAGIYHENILLDVSPERLRRFFIKADGYYQVKKQLRDMCLFARQNVVVDPPFSNIDIISCRNVLIYLTPVLQKRVMPVFHYALRPGGFLILGNSENIGEPSELFGLVDKKNKIYTKKLTSYRPALNFERGFVPREAPEPALRAQQPAGELLKDASMNASLQQNVDRLILGSLSPAGVVINAQMDVLQFRGDTGAFLQHQPGSASLNLLRMIAEGLALDVRRMLNQATRSGQPVEHDAAEYRFKGKARRVNIKVYPLSLPEQTERFFLVLFQEAALKEIVPADSRPGKRDQKRMDNRQIEKLKADLADTKDSLQAIIEEQEATNEELKSANEEIQSSNEELQSTNEELETAREELQSTNEELTTLNQELNSRNLELAQLNNDLNNLLSSVNIAILMLGTDFKVRRFTPMAEKIFNLIPSDVGRRLSDLNRNINVPDLDETIQNVTDNLTVVEREVQDRDGRWYSLRIRPYRTREGRIDGVVLVLFDIDELKSAIGHVLTLMRQPLLALQADLKISFASEAFCKLAQLSPSDCIGKPMYEIGNKQWKIPRLRQLLEEILPNQGEVRDFRIEHEFDTLGKRSLIVNARRFYDENRGLQWVILAIEDTTSAD